MRYLTGLFVVDLLSSIPYALIPFLKSFKFVSILKALRVTRLSDLIDRLQMDEESKSLLKLGYTIAGLFLIMHVLGCTWYSFVKA